MDRFKFRIQIVLVIVLLWGLLNGAWLFYYSVYAASAYVEAGNKLAWRQGRIPATRGRIFDNSGKLLAWNEKFFDLVLLDIPSGIDKKEKLINTVQRVVKDAQFPKVLVGKKVFVIRKSLSPGQVADLADVLKSFRELKVELRYERRYIDYFQVQAYLGGVKIVDGVFRGVKGIEKIYDEKLRGVDGLYFVMLDRNGNWIPSTSRIKQKMIPGKDVHLDVSIRDITDGKIGNNAGKQK